MNNFFTTLLSNNTEISSTRLAYIAINIIAIIILAVCCIIMLVDTFKTGIKIDYFKGIAEIILAVSVLIAVSGMAKAFSDKFQKEQKKEYYGNEKGIN